MYRRNLAVVRFFEGFCGVVLRAFGSHRLRPFVCGFEYLGGLLVRRGRVNSIWVVCH